MQKLKVNDEVVILAGKDAGKKGTVKKINFKRKTVLVEGVNLYKKADQTNSRKSKWWFC
jgi:large subunit ribosomal protein L24